MTKLLGCCLLETIFLIETGQNSFASFRLILALNESHMPYERMLHKNADYAQFGTKSNAYHFRILF